MIRKPIQQTGAETANGDCGEARVRLWQQATSSHNDVRIELGCDNDCVLWGADGPWHSYLLASAIGRAPLRDPTRVQIAVDDTPSALRARSMISVVEPGDGFEHPKLKVGDAIRYRRRLFPEHDPNMLAALLEHAPELRPNAKIGSLSEVDARVLVLILALVGRPALLLFHDPLRGTDLAGQSTFLGVYRRYRDFHSVAALWTVRDPVPLLRFASHLGYAESGQLVFAGSADDLRRSARRLTLRARQGWQLPATLARCARVQSRDDAIVSLFAWGEHDERTEALARSGAIVIEERALPLSQFIQDFPTTHGAFE